MPIKTMSGDGVNKKLRLKLLSAATAAAIAVSSCMIVYAAGENPRVKIIDGLKSQTVTSSSTDPVKIVNEAGYVLDANDKLVLDFYSKEKGGTIIIKRARLFRIEEDGMVSYILGYDTDDFSALTSPFKKADNSDSSSVTEDIPTSIKQAFTVNIFADGKTHKAVVSSGTVKDAIEKAGIKLGRSDTVSPALDSVLTGKTGIRISRVSYRLRSETEEIPFETSIEFDSSLPMGETKVVRAGSAGKKKVFYLDKYVNGELASSESKSELTLVKPVNQTVKAGPVRINRLGFYDSNGIPISEIDAPDWLKVNSNGAPSSYKYCIEGKATAYAGDTTTATGVTPVPGCIAVNPKQIPYGTECYVVSADGKYVYGYCRAVDTGGFVHMGNTTIDLFMNTEDMCNEWGNRPVKIYIL